MRTNGRVSFGARLYALLLYLYPRSFRREYGESMLQLFNDQRRAVSGSGGNAMLWLKTLRDLVLSVPAAHSNERQPGGQRRPSAVGALFVVVVATVLAGAAFLFSLAQRSLWNGAAVFVAGALLSIFMLGSNPWIWMRQGEPSIAGLWMLAVWPLAAIAWAALMIAKRRQRLGGA